MNIEKRIIRLEEKANITPGFCKCKETSKSETYWQDLTSDAETNEPHLMSDPVPDVCPLCGREIEKKILILRGVESDIPKPEGVL